MSVYVSVCVCVSVSGREQTDPSNEVRRIVR